MIFKLGDLEVLKQNDNYVFNEKLGINDVEFQHGKRNRDFCLAPLNRVEMLEGHKCLHNCKYCFLGSK